MPDALTRLKDALADRYALGRELGSGGMATVYLARDLRHDRQVAVKVLRPDLAATLGSERFFREIQVAARLQHPHILPLLDSGEAGGFYYYVMPYVPGESLRERIAKHGELPVHESVKLLCEVVDALAAAHASGVVHRDIKPDNVMLSGRHALVTDFGVAKAVSEATGRQKLTTAGVALGTPSYMAPEQAAADPQLDHRVDIYAVGVLGYEMLTGSPPFTGRTPQEILAAQVTQAPEPITKHRPAVPAALESVLMKCLEKRAADRWQTAEELLGQLESLATPSLGMTPTQTRPVAAHGKPPRQFPRWAAWVAGGALVAAGALALSLRQRSPAVLHLGTRTALAISPDMEMWPSLSPDGKMVAYTFVRSRGDFGIALLQVGGGAPITLTEGPDPWVSAISPDGSSLLLSGPRQLAVMPLLGGAPRPVVTDRGALGATWSPDGKRIAFASDDTLYQQNRDGGVRTALAGGVGLHSPAWSPDGRWIACVEGNQEFYLNGNNAPSRILLIPAGGGARLAITDSSSFNTSPIWIPGRRALLFISDRDGGRDIYQVELTGNGRPAGAPVRITTGLNPGRITLSADGKRIAWSTGTQTSNIWAIPIAERDSIPLSRGQQVTRGSQDVEQGAVSQDGKWLYYDANQGGHSNIWRLPVTGGAPERLTSDSADDFAPAPSPDGRWVAFHSTRNGSNNRDIFVIPSAGGRAVQVSTSPGDDRVPYWSPDGAVLSWSDADGRRADSTILLAHRRPDGSWSKPERLGLTGFVSGRWRPTGEVTYRNRSGIWLYDSAARTPRLLIDSTALEGSTGAYTAWSDDGMTLYYLIQYGERIRIQAVTLPGGQPRTLAYTDDPAVQNYRWGLAARGGNLYLSLGQMSRDIWVADVQ